MSVVSMAGFENSFPCVFQAFHRAISGLIQNIRFLTVD
jgi:hypothetical protein